MPGFRCFGINRRQPERVRFSPFRPRSHKLLLFAVAQQNAFDATGVVTGMFSLSGYRAWSEMKKGYMDAAHAQSKGHFAVARSCFSVSAIWTLQLLHLSQCSLDDVLPFRAPFRPTLWLLFLTYAPASRRIIVRSIFHINPRISLLNEEGVCRRIHYSCANSRTCAGVCCYCTPDNYSRI